MNLNDTNLTGALLEALPLAVIVADHSERISLLNPAAESILGWNTADAMGHPITELWASAPEARRGMAQIRAAGGSLVAPVEVVFRRRDGEDVLGRLSVHPLTDTVGETIGLLGIFEDLRAAKAQDRRLTEVVEQLWEAEQRVSGLGRMSSAIHALSQPLTAAMGMVELLQDTELEAPARERLEKVSAQMLRLRSGLTDLSRLVHAPAPQNRRYP